MLKRELDEIVTLSEEELAEGVRLALRATHNLAEGAGAASLMAAMKMRRDLEGMKVACVMSGGNLDAGTLRRVLAVA
jgi:threonine dehydratase